MNVSIFEFRDTAESTRSMREALVVALSAATELNELPRRWWRVPSLRLHDGVHGGDLQLDDDVGHVRIRNLVGHAVLLGIVDASVILKSRELFVDLVDRDK